VWASLTGWNLTPLYLLGSAAIYGLRGKKHVECFIMFPNGRVSEIQERQMTTVEDGNIHCLR
jgi:threonine synthase